MNCNADLGIVTHTHTHTHTGRSSMKQLMPQKPVKRGFKVWVRADTATGYFCDIDMYVGKPSDGVRIEVGLRERVILQSEGWQLAAITFW